MFVSTTRVQLKRPTTANERERLGEVFDGMAKAPGFHGLYGISPSETEAVTVAVFDTEAHFQKASEEAYPAIQAALGPIVIGTSRRDSGEVNAQYINLDTVPGFLSIRRVHVKNAISPAERPSVGKLFADAAAMVPQGRHAFYEIWFSDTELMHVGVYDSPDGRKRFSEQAGPYLRPAAAAVGGSVGTAQETTGDVVVYRVRN